MFAVDFVKSRRMAAGAIAATLLALVAGGCSSSTTNSVDQPGTGVGSSGLSVEPYVDVTLSKLPDFKALKANGATGVVFAFANAAGKGWAEGCTPSFGPYRVNDLHIQSAARAARDAGLNIAVSFGGQTAGDQGIDLAETCNFAGAEGDHTLVNAYAAALKGVSANRADFDVEGATLVNAHSGGDKSSFANRNDAIKKLPSVVPGIMTTYTMSTGQNGLQKTDAWGDIPGHLSAMAAAGMGSAVGRWNWMAFDWWVPQPANMGDAVVASIQATNSDLAKIMNFPLADIQKASMLTTMPGNWDGNGQVVNNYLLLTDMATVSKYLRSIGAPTISMWSASRDNGSCAGNPGAALAQPTCSGLAQRDFQFTSVAADPNQSIQ